jgi:hypothetical protein
MLDKGYFEGVGHGLFDGVQIYLASRDGVLGQYRSSSADLGATSVSFTVQSYWSISSLIIQTTSMIPLDEKYTKYDVYNIINLLYISE